MQIKKVMLTLEDGKQVEAKFEFKDGVLVVEPVRRNPRPELVSGWYVSSTSDIIEYGEDSGKLKCNLNLFPTRSAAEWFGLIMPQLLQNYKALVGEWKIGDDTYWSVFFRWTFSNIRIGIDCFKSGPLIPGAEFPFPTQALAQQFLDENIELLNKIKEVTYV